VTSARVVSLAEAKPWNAVELEHHTVLWRMNGVNLLDFEAYAVSGIDQNGVRLYENEHSNYQAIPLSEARRYMHGSIRFDGCVNFMFDACAENCMLHECGRGGFRQTADMLEKLYDVAAEQMPQHEDYLR
jgi:hypothetical protein